MFSIHCHTVAIIVAAILCNHVSFSLQDCDSAVTKLNTFTGLCNNKWKNIKTFVKPTQSQVGFAWIQLKIAAKFNTFQNAQTEIDTAPTPVVIGPGPAYYIVDEHHTLCALDYSEFTEVSVTFDVICDKRNMTLDDFWNDMSSHNLVYLAAHPSKEHNKLPKSILYSQLPETFAFTKSYTSFSDDPWRSIAGYSRKVEDVAAAGTTCVKGTDSQYCERCMFRGCEDGYKTSGRGVPFFEFRWAYYLNDATYYSPLLWDNADDYIAFRGAYEKLSLISSSTSSSAVTLSDVNTSDWFAAAALVIPLCRSKAGGGYTLPGDLFPAIAGDTDDVNSLPGYQYGYVKLLEDPSCNSPTCI